MKNYYLKFGSGDSASFSGLSPTFIIFNTLGVTATSAPGITESPSGSGLYGFQFAPTLSILFKADGGANLAATDRYIYGALDPIQSIDEKIGTLSDSFGSTSVDPTTILGYLKRNQEATEGAAVFTKSTAIWDVYSRGASTLLFEKTLTNTVTSATKN